MRRPFLYRLGETVHLVSLGVWAGMVAGAGVTAAITFPAMKALEPTLGVYDQYDGDHAVLAGGTVASRVFLATDVAQFVCAFFAVVGFAAAMVAGGRDRTVLQFLRAVAIGAALLLVSYHLLLLMPGMQTDLANYWSAAADGRTEDADVFKQAFLDQHPDSTRSMTLILLSVLLSMILGAWSIARKAGPANPANPTEGSP